MILYYSIIIQQISTVKKSSANLCQCCSLHQWRAGQAHCDCGGSVHQHRGCSRSVGRGNPSVASPSPSESPHRSESWGVMGRHGVSNRVGKLQLCTSFGFVVFHSRTQLSYMWVYIRLFPNVWGTCFEAKTEVEAGCLQHGRLLATCHGRMAFSVSAALRSPESLHLSLPPGDPIASLVAVWLWWMYHWSMYLRV